MTNEWYVSREDKTYGPFTSVQLKQLADSSRIGRDDQVRTSEGRWVAANTVNGLFIDDLPKVQFPPNTYAKLNNRAVERMPLAMRRGLAIATLILCGIVIVVVGNGLTKDAPKAEKSAQTAAPSDREQIEWEIKDYMAKKLLRGGEKIGNVVSVTVSDEFMAVSLDEKESICETLWMYYFPDVRFDEKNDGSIQLIDWRMGTRIGTYTTASGLSL